MDDYTDDILAFHTEEDFRKRLLNYSHAFIMGVPLSIVDSGYTPDYPSAPNPRKSTPKRLFDFETKKTTETDSIKTKTKDNYDTGSSKKKDDDDDDLDWL
jgi:hypothetical protein